MRVIGTAGHVDHGKSTLIAALTGTHPDRLKEEQEREMTIELGFGWLTLPGGEEIGIVDVPGHRDFIENMLSGIAGIDAALLVIAADEGVMPQTREHLAILDLLQIPSGMIALTKTDLIEDQDWLALVEADIREAVTGTMLAGAPIVRVSARRKTGLEALLTQLATTLEGEAPRLDLGRPRLPVDRAFSMPGFGTVVTGTLSDGKLTLGEEVVLLPSGHKGRIRGLQTHKKKEEHAIPGSRTAVNVSGVAVDQIRRGDVLAYPGHYQPSRRLDARLRVLGDIRAPLKHGLEVKVFIAASESMATLRLLGADALAPGETGWVQLEMRTPVVAVRGDRFILRRPSPGETLGGGTIIDHQPRGRHRRRDPNVLRSLESLAKGSPAEVLLEAAMAFQVAPVREMVARSRLDGEAAAQALRELVEDHALLVLSPGEVSITSPTLAVARGQWNALRERALGFVREHHDSNPLKRGIPREELKSRLKLTTAAFSGVTQALLAERELVEVGNALALPGHEIRLSESQEVRAGALLERFEQNPFAPPSVKECQAEVGADVVAALIELGELKQLSAEVLFRTQDYEQMVARIRAFLQERGEISVADARDLFDSSRKYMLALMEHLDSIGTTTREGDVRRLRA